MKRFTFTAPVELRDLASGMELVLQPEGCPVRVLGVSRGNVHIEMPDRRSRFIVPVASLLRVDRWRAVEASAKAVA